jgi:hypothetical protein
MTHDINGDMNSRGHTLRITHKSVSKSPLALLIFFSDYTRSCPDDFTDLVYTDISYTHDLERNDKY